MSIITFKNYCQLYGVQAWYDLTDFATITTDTSLRLSLIKDKSGNGWDLSQSGGNRPDFVVSDTNNALPTMLSQSGRTIVNSSFSLPVPFTVYAYMKQNAYMANGAVLVDFGDGQLRGISQKPNNEGGIGHGLQFCDESAFFPGKNSLGNNGWALYRFSVDATGQLTTSINDEPNIGGDTRWGSQNVGTTTLSKIILGDTSGNNGNFNYQELIMLDHVTTDIEHNGIVTYFMAKYNTVKTIPFLIQGDSIAADGHPSVGANGWTQLVSAAKSVNRYNFSITNATIGYATAYSNINVNAVYNTIKIGTNRSGYVALMLGHNESNVDINWKASLTQWVNYQISQGYSKSRIILASELYDPANAFITTTAGYMSTVATALGVIYAPIYEYGVIHTVSGSLLDGSGHPNDAGNAAMATVFEGIMV